jgi:hypothetical protein
MLMELVETSIPDIWLQFQLLLLLDCTVAGLKERSHHLERENRYQNGSSLGKRMVL